LLATVRCSLPPLLGKKEPCASTHTLFCVCSKLVVSVLVVATQKRGKPALGKLALRAVAPHAMRILEVRWHTSCCCSRQRARCGERSVFTTPSALPLTQRQYSDIPCPRHSDVTDTSSLRHHYHCQHRHHHCRSTQRSLIVSSVVDLRRNWAVSYIGRRASDPRHAHTW